MSELQTILKKLSQDPQNDRLLHELAEAIARDEELTEYVILKLQEAAKNVKIH